MWSSNYLLILLIQVISSHLINCEMYMKPIQNENHRAVSKAIHDVIDLLYVKNNDKFDILIMGQGTS